MKTNSNNNRNFISNFATVTAVFVMFFAVAFTNSASSQNDGLSSENTATWNYSEFDMTGSYDLIATDKMALSPDYQVSLSADGNYYIMSTVNGNSGNYQVGYIGQLSAPRIGTSNIDVQINLDEALETTAPVDPYTALLITSLHTIK
jgi:hypothetical protein